MILRHVFKYGGEQRSAKCMTLTALIHSVGNLMAFMNYRVCRSVYAGSLSSPQALPTPAAETKPIAAVQG